MRFLCGVVCMYYAVKFSQCYTMPAAAVRLLLLKGGIIVKISKIRGFEVLDSRGNPTVRAEVVLSDGIAGAASVPSGASTGKREAVELRDGDPSRYNGKGVLSAVDNIRKIIAPELCSCGALTQKKLDELLIELDGTQNKSRLGANALLAVSLAYARACSVSCGMPLYRYIGGIYGGEMPVPMMNILNGGVHAANNIDIQEFMIRPFGAENFAQALRMGTEIYHALGKILKTRGISCGVGDEGGFAPNLSSNEEAIELLIEAIETAGYSTYQVSIALDAAASEWRKGKKYVLPKSGREFSTEELVCYWEELCRKYPVSSLEDAMSEDDWQGWQQLTKKLGAGVQLVGDDIFVTDTSLLKRGISSNAANAILIKYNQTGTLTEAMNAVKTAQKGGFGTIISHRSGETEDTTIADLAVGLNAGQIKTGAPCRSDRTAKYNRLLRIEQELH